MFENILTGYEVRFLIDLFLSLVAGFLIGAERESRGKAAGISTHALVITGSMLFTFMSSVVDPASKSRIASNVITGVGFLGAGIILQKESGKIENLTTAASIWFSGAIGMALGFDFHLIAIMSTIFCMLIPRISHINKKNILG